MQFSGNLPSNDLVVHFPLIPTKSRLDFPSGIYLIEVKVDSYFPSLIFIFSRGGKFQLERTSEELVVHILLIPPGFFPVG